MKGAGFAAMDDERDEQEALAAAGYTGLRGAVVFCALVGALGAMLGSIVLAILWNMMVPERQDVSTLVGAVAGGALGLLLAVTKIRRGNREALEEVEDKAWRRHMLRTHGK